MDMYVRRSPSGPTLLVPKLQKSHTCAGLGCRQARVGERSIEATCIRRQPNTYLVAVSVDHLDRLALPQLDCAALVRRNREELARFRDGLQIATEHDVPGGEAAQFEGCFAAMAHVSS